VKFSIITLKNTLFLYDNLKSAVSKGYKYTPLINKTLKDRTLHYRCLVDPTRLYHAQDKALVE
jgi:hypothetical protein